MQRDKTIDIAKGIGIILVVIGHLSGVTGTTSPMLLWLKSFLYQFHIPLFFFLSGIFFNKEEAWNHFLIKKIKRLYIPFVTFNIIFLIVDVILRLISGISIIPTDEFKHTVKIILGIGLAPLGGATWFLIALIRAVIIYKLINTIFDNKEKEQLFVSVSCIIIGVTGLFITGKYYIGSSMVAVAFYWLGDYSRTYLLNLKNCRIWNKTIILILSFIVLTIIRQYNTTDVSMALYENRFLVIVGSCSGIIFIMMLSDILSNIGQFSRILCFIGKNTMTVLIGHFAAFKILIILQVLIFDAPTTDILSHPCYDVSGLWALLYFIVGMIIPLAVSSMNHVSTHEK